jgi:hypothetical protein
LAPENRARIGSCGKDDPDFAPGDKCLRFGQAAVDLIDLDFSRRNYFVFKQGAQAQRGVSAYEALRLPFDKNEDRPGLLAPLVDLDDLMSFDLTQRRVIARASNGACSSGETIYEQDGARLRPVRARNFVTDSNGICRMETYTANPVENGEGYELNLLSSEPAH